MKVRKIPLMLLEKFKIVLRYRKINIREINNTSKMVVSLKKSIHYFKHEEPISIKKHISKKDYTKIIISNFIHESNCLLEFINYLDLAVNTTPNLYCSFIKKYSINVDKMVENIDLDLFQSDRIDHSLHISEILNELS